MHDDFLVLISIEIPAPPTKPRVKKLPKPKRTYESMCKKCGARIVSLLRIRKICDGCINMPPTLQVKAEKPKLYLPCPRCGVSIDVSRRGRPTMCRPCSKTNTLERNRSRYANDIGYRTKVKASCTNYDRRRGIKPAEESYKIAAERVKLSTPFKTCRVCGVIKQREKFSRGCVCNKCRNKTKAQREKHPSHPKRIAMQIEAGRREILKHFDLFAPEREQRKIESKQRGRAKERSTPEGRLNRNISEMIRLALKKNKAGWRSTVGWTLAELKVHLEKQFRLGMSWDNYGEWHLDHIKARSLFVFSSPHDPQFKECWSLANLQPLWAHENTSKSDQYPCPYHGQMLV